MLVPLTLKSVFCVCLFLFLSIVSLCACIPIKKGPCLLAELICSLNISFHFHSLYSFFPRGRRDKQEATQGILTSWPSDMIGSVLLPSQTKGFWKQGVISWLGLHVAMNEGVGGWWGLQKERKRAKAQSCCVCLFIQTVQLLCGFSMAGAHTNTNDSSTHFFYFIFYFLSHTFPGSNVLLCTNDPGVSPVLFRSLW